MEIKNYRLNGGDRKSTGTGFNLQQLKKMKGMLQEQLFQGWTATAVKNRRTPGGLTHAPQQPDFYWAELSTFATFANL